MVATGPVRGQRRTPRAAAAPVVALLAAGLTACGPGEPAGPPPTPVPPTGVGVEVLQGRMDIARGLMSLRVVNDGDAPVVVVEASYDDSRFASSPRWTGDQEVPAGRARELRVPVPDPACDGGLDEPPSAELVLATADGPATVRLPVVDEFDVVGTVTEQGCFAAAVAELATVGIDEVTTRGEAADEVAVLHVTVTTSGDAPLHLASVAGTGLLRPASGDPGWALDAVVAPGEGRTFELAVVPARCDLHAIAEDKVGTRFWATLTPGDEPTGRLVLAADDAQRALLFDYVLRRCAATA